jgi:hypothetical protein
VAVHPETVELPIGRHEIRVSSPGYDSALRSVDLMSNAELKTVDRIILDRFTGSAKLLSRPTGVEFELKMTQSDANRPEEFAGMISAAPVALPNLPTGVYELSWRQQGRVERRSNLTIRSGETVPVEVDLRLAEVNLNSNPDKATIFWNDQRLGETPLHKWLPQGIHKLEARYDNWPVKLVEITADPDKLNELSFEWDYDIVNFDSAPQGARIFLGSEELGVTPFSRPLKAGVATVRAFIPDLDEIQREISVTPGLKGRVVFQFDYGVIQIESEPPGATIIGPDGNPLKMGGDHELFQNLLTPAQILRRPGPVRLRLEMKGYQSVIISDSLRAQRMLKLKGTLERE